jgi:16S rRNA (adenine1518-N6/adenine1519-N6)-dimethyltransferase
MTFEHKKSLGQNFLNSEYVPQQMCDAAKLTGGEVVLEIGPGTGALTAEILKRGAKVIALEADPRAITELEQRFVSEIHSGQFTLHHGDARTLNPSTLGLSGGDYQVIANIPYYLTGLLFRSLLTSDQPPQNLVFLIQKEVAERIARAKKESLLSLSVKAYGQPRYITTIKRHHFTPPPKVDSAILAVYDISKTNFSQLSEDLFFNLLHLGFGQKRKQLLGNLTAHYSRPQLEEVFQDLQLPTTIRAEDLSLNEWLTLTEAITSLATTE